jgi:hypothetical protein
MVPTAKFKSTVRKQKGGENRRHVKMEDKTMGNEKDEKILYIREGTYKIFYWQKLAVT